MEEINDNLDKQGHKIKVQRLVKVWVEDIYYVDEVNQDVINAAINYDIDSDDSYTIWETMEEVGNYDVFDDERNLIYSRHHE